MSLENMSSITDWKREGGKRERERKAEVILIEMQTPK